MTSRHVITGRVTSTGCSVTQFTSRPRQLPFANDVASTASRVSVTKASGLSDTLGAERSLNGKDGDTVTLSPRLMPAPPTAFI